MKGPRRARMPVYGAGSKCPGCTEKETEWRRFHAPQAPGNSHCTPTGPGNSHLAPTTSGSVRLSGNDKPGRSRLMQLTPKRKHLTRIRVRRRWRSTEETTLSEGHSGKTVTIAPIGTEAVFNNPAVFIKSHNTH
jgi:hypothetical protein